MTGQSTAPTRERTAGPASLRAILADLRAGLEGARPETVLADQSRVFRALTDLLLSASSSVALADEVYEARQDIIAYFQNVEWGEPTDGVAAIVGRLERGLVRREAATRLDRAYAALPATGM